MDLDSGAFLSAAMEGSAELTDQIADNRKSKRRGLSPVDVSRPSDVQSWAR